ncbi:hypothetical protein KSF_066200 [Reticulibacter mediterranei]|uniref:Knr4/Smi1-like domain-containing protein n=1 Tax=Reticulibacter mediterranei TaxID=2778369 RepID=A0A8J3N6X5_9CHLR|nr:hypothetical protein KSF_066200 [Reticulibacter mediterranei]
MQQVEAFLPVTLPEEVKTLYRIHDGQGDHEIGSWRVTPSPQGLARAITILTGNSPIPYCGRWHVSRLPI